MLSFEAYMKPLPMSCLKRTALEIYQFITQAHKSTYEPYHQDFLFLNILNSPGGGHVAEIWDKVSTCFAHVRMFYNQFRKVSCLYTCFFTYFRIGMVYICINCVMDCLSGRSL